MNVTTILAGPKVAQWAQVASQNVSMMTHPLAMLSTGLWSKRRTGKSFGRVT